MSQKQVISTEIAKELQQILGKDPVFSQKMPFEQPSAYFDGFTTNILAKIEVENFINTLPKDNSYLVPDGYLENFSAQKVIDHQPKARVFSLNLKWVTGIAASIALVVGIYFFQLASGGNAIEKQMASIPINEANDYLNDNLSDFETFSLVANSEAAKPLIEPMDEITDTEMQSYVDENVSDELL